MKCPPVKGGQDSQRTPAPSYMQHAGTVNAYQTTMTFTPEASGSQHPDFSLTPISIVQDGRLSWAARGMLVYLLSLPEDLYYTAQELADNSPDGADLMRSLLRELEAVGYLKQTEQGYCLVLDA